MRVLNDKEKEIVRYLVNAANLRDHAIIKLIDEYVNVCAIVWDSQYKYISIYSRGDLHTIENSYNELLELIFLLDYLRSNMYISIYSLTGERTNAIYNREKYKFDESEELVTEIEESLSDDKTGIIFPSTLKIYTDIGKSISLYAQSAFYVSENLREFVKNDFKTDEQLKFEKQMNDTQAKHKEAMHIANRTLRCTQLAFFVALISTLSTFTIGIFEKKDMTIRELNNTIKEKNIPEVVETKLCNDTIKAIIISQPESNPNKSVKKRSPQNL